MLKLHFQILDNSIIISVGDKVQYIGPESRFKNKIGYVKIINENFVSVQFDYSNFLTEVENIIQL